MTDLRKHLAGYSVLNKLYEIQSERPPLNKLASFLGFSPLLEEGRSWHAGLIGETEVGDILEPLKSEGYMVLHSVPIGDNGTDIDHIVATPSGIIYTVNTKHHKGKAIWAAGTSVLISGQKSDHVKKSRAEASRVRRLLETVDHSKDRHVVPLLVFVEASKINSKENAVITALHSHQLVKYIRDIEKTRLRPNSYLFADAPEDNNEFLLTSEFWTKSYVDETGQQEERRVWLKRLTRQVRTQHIKQGVWRLVGTLVLIALGSGALLIGLPLLFGLLSGVVI